MAQVSLFVSHSHEDNEWCRPLVAALKAVGYDVWYDETGLTGGASWVASIQREAQARDVFLLVLTPEAWASQWVQDELQLAIATRRRILPVLLRNTQVDGFLLTTQWVTVIGEDPQVAARSIIMAIEAPPAPGRSAAPQAQTETLDDLVTLCRSLTNERRYTEALSTCGRALALDPDNVDVLRLKGWVLLQIGETQKAIEDLGRMLSVAPGERLAPLTREALNWLERPAVDRQGGNSSFLSGWVNCFGLLLPHVKSGLALYEVCQSLLGHVLSRLDDPGAANLFSGVPDASLFREALAIYQDRHKWTTTTITNFSDKPIHRAFLLRLLCSTCYGYPPTKATSVDIDGLRYYKTTLAVLVDTRAPEGLYSESTKETLKQEMTVIEQYIQRLSRPV